MKKLLRKTARVIMYFLTPEDSGQPMRHGTLLFGIDAGSLTIGSVKAVFWLIISLVLPYLFSRL